MPGLLLFAGRLENAITENCCGRSGGGIKHGGAIAGRFAGGRGGSGFCRRGKGGNFNGGLGSRLGCCAGRGRHGCVWAKTIVVLVRGVAVVVVIFAGGAIVVPAFAVCVARVRIGAYGQCKKQT